MTQSFELVEELLSGRVGLENSVVLKQGGDNIRDTLAACISKSDGHCEKAEVGAGANVFHVTVCLEVACPVPARITYLNICYYYTTYKQHVFK